jgi:hypothetical protein
MSYWGASRCQPIGDPGRYSLISAMANASAWTPAQSASGAQRQQEHRERRSWGAIVRLAEERDTPTSDNATHFEVRKRNVGDRVEELALLGVGDDVVAIVEAFRQILLEEAWRSGHAPSVPQRP